MRTGRGRRHNRNHARDRQVQDMRLATVERFSKAFCAIRPVPRTSKTRSQISEARRCADGGGLQPRCIRQFKAPHRLEFVEEPGDFVGLFRLCVVLLRLRDKGYSGCLLQNGGKDPSLTPKGELIRS
jgi:hypothetical protein